MPTEKPVPEAHVVFELAVEDGWPPVGSERVRAHHLGGDRYRIGNPPWFVHDLAVGDVVRAQAPDSDSHPVFVEILERSGHVTIRLICFRRGPLAGDLAQALEPFTALGVYGEGAQEYGMLALDIEPAAPSHRVEAAPRCRRRFMGVRGRPDNARLDRCDRGVTDRNAHSAVSTLQ